MLAEKWQVKNEMLDFSLPLESARSFIPPSGAVAQARDWSALP
jgi:hypothetical protein